MKFRIVIIISVLAFFAVSCEEDPERHLKLGNWYYQKGLVDDAILEYREVIRLHSPETTDLSREELNTVMKAHYNLAISYSKKGWYEHALKEAEMTFDIWPTKDNYEMVELLKKRRSLERLDIETSS
ncbi:MAG: hypothetical protein QF613_03455 [Candidatus Marinimicrobia bacterium]|jgi:tetratricopeptide (TPR) repeat protein|nr:hypothetical protein [Candidatus Neomarinimicrobiota bacterium]MDP6456529.1 hypothetical protein [Candidatus Neomarinimicrobiota bacterium]MDP6593251.1 hypothetical protein [Candidatus Neomarinimicrobiota bacterium]MDP6836045.1 hypothetical protein [Candidatus Neomarinimicrobiota bacterium]MDP6965685.1 hypothetical protein [Candidatus Neomarinimicrobiota bacterium]|tara:strand:+ start:3749 stop:4129 length:381 start_codon:yes stop_codon:yes gene_type:complete